MNFSIGFSFKESVLWDVVPMDVDHILLGRPWQFDRGTIHDGAKNTYSLYQGNKKYVLKLMKDDALEKRSEKSHALVNLADFVKATKRTKFVFAIDGKEGIKPQMVPHHAQGIIDQFKDVMPQELPNGYKCPIC